jgi:hypothetical protein
MFIAVVVGAGGILLSIFLPHSVRSPALTGGDQSRRDYFRNATKQGTILKISELAEGERIVIDQIKQWDVGGPEGYTYVILGGTEKAIYSIERIVEWKPGWGVPFCPAHLKSVSTL